MIARSPAPLLVVLLAPFLLCSDAKAELRLCNDAPFRVWTAVGYSAGGGAWTAEGWWELVPGGCKVVVGGELQGRYYYVHAHDDGSQHTWGSEYTFCTKQSEPFTLRDSPDCAARGYSKHAFYKVDAGQNKSYTSRLTCPDCRRKDGWRLSLGVPEVRGGVVIDGRELAAPTSGRIDVDFSSSNLYATVTANVDLSAFQSGLPSIIQAHVNENDDCNEIVNVHTITLAPHGSSLSVYAAAHYEDWECPSADVFGWEVSGGKHRIFEQNGDATIRLTPQTNGSSVWMRVDVASMNADGVLGELLRNNIFGPWIRDMILQAIPAVIQIGSIRDVLPPPLWGFPLQLREVAFYDRGGGVLGLRIVASVTVTAAHATDVWKNLQR